MDARRRLLDDRVTRWENALGAVTRGRFYIGFYPLAYVATVQLLRSAMGRLSRPTGSTASSRDSARPPSAPPLRSIASCTPPAGAWPRRRPTWRTQSATSSYCRWSSAARCCWLGVQHCRGSCSRRNHAQRHRRHARISFRHRRSSRRNSALISTRWPGRPRFCSCPCSVWLKAANARSATSPTRGRCGAAERGRDWRSGHPLNRLRAHRAVGRVMARDGDTLWRPDYGLTLSARDLRILTEERHRQAQTDELTGLGNRRYLFHVLEDVLRGLRQSVDDVAKSGLPLHRPESLQGESTTPWTPGGRRITSQLGPRLNRVVPATGSVFRLGGDELAVVLVDADENRRRSRRRGHPQGDLRIPSSCRS